MSDPSATINQPGGPFVAVAHDAVRGREVELRVLADAFRELAELSMTADLDVAETAAMADRVIALGDELERFRPEVPVPRFTVEAQEAGPREQMSPFDVITGLYNPVALPLAMTYDDEFAIGRGQFGVLHAGPPGRLHGAVIAACFDMVLAGANRVAGRHGPTANLTVTYERPTVLDKPVTFRCWQERSEGRKIHSAGELIQEDEVTARARGLFIHMDRSAIEKMGAD